MAGSIFCYLLNGITTGNIQRAGILFEHIYCFSFFYWWYIIFFQSFVQRFAWNEPQVCNNYSINFFYFDYAMDTTISRQLKSPLTIKENVIWHYLLFILICIGFSFVFIPDNGNLISSSAMRSLQ